MRRGIRGLWLGVCLLAGGPCAFAVDTSLKTCTKTFSVSSAEADHDVSVRSVLSSKPAKLCSLDCLSLRANGWGAAWDSPDGTTTHAQAVVKAEKGAATAGDSEGTAETARYTEFGLTIEAHNAACTGSWVD